MDGRNWRPYLGLGHLYQGRSFWDLDADAKRERAREAKAFYEQSVAKNPFDAEGLFGLAKVHNTLGEDERALEYMRESVRRNPRHLFYVSHLGLQLRRMGRYEEALAIFRDARDRWGSDMIDINIRFLQEKLAEQKESAPPQPAP
ncbi:MAG: Tetratricopeptide repeat protein [Verrucomicrobia bacterium ADurb.Bin345]|nr:MAG: Tetratricopeptide repeat protein [Verrucomicrobia bacterium ADurb.Bin345]